MPGETQQTLKRFRASTPKGPPGSGPGTQGNVNTNPADDWIGSPQDSSVYYGNLPQSQGNVNVNVSNPSGGNYQGPVVNTGGDTGGGTDTGSGSSGGSGSGSGSKGPAGMTLDEIRLFNNITGSNIDILSTEGGYESLFNKSKDGLTINDAQTREDLENLQAKQLNTTPLNLKDQVNRYLGQDTPLGEFSLNKAGLGFTTDSGIEYGVSGSLAGGKPTLNLGATIPTNRIFDIFRAQGGPVGLMSLPQGYAAGGGVDPSDWRVIQQIIAAGGNPEDYVYANGGEVIEGTDTMEELTPFGGTRENVWDQVEAFDNAPVHMEEPMIGMWGEKVPLTTARRVQKYMEGMDPVKRGLIEEMMQMFSMKNMMRKHQEQRETGQFFGPQPKEYDI